MVFKMAFNQVLENVQVNNIVLAAAGEGVISGLDVSERGAGVNMSVDVATGSALIGGTTYTESSIVHLTISAADATHARKDLVIYDVATTNPLIVAGTPATPPIPPDITTGDILLAIVDVAANETEITNGEITDCIVEVVTGGSLDGLSNVLISSVGDNEVLAWDTSSSKWINQTPAEAALAALAGFTMTGDINMGDNNFIGVNEFRAYDVNGVDFDNSGGTRRIRLALTSYSFSADAMADMGGYKIVSVGDPDNAQDVATKNWIETSAVAYNAGKVDGCDAGIYTGQVYKIPATSQGYVLFFSGTGIVTLATGTNGYQLTTHAAGNNPTWSAASDLIFSDTHCPKCDEEFKDGDDLILHVIGHNEVGDILTIPMHLSCANQPKKTVIVKRKVFEDQYILDELTGEPIVQRVQKMEERVVTKHKLKEGYVMDAKSGKARKLDKDGNKGKMEYTLSASLETVEETINEIIYESVEYEL